MRSERGEVVLGEINGMVEEIIGILRQSERKLTEQLKRVTDAKLEILQLNFMVFSTLVKIRSLSSVLSWT